MRHGDAIKNSINSFNFTLIKVKIESGLRELDLDRVIAVVDFEPGLAVCLHVNA